MKFLLLEDIPRWHHLLWMTMIFTVSDAIPEQGNLF